MSYSYQDNLTVNIRRLENGEGNGNPLQYYCLENPMDRGADQSRLAKAMVFQFSCVDVRAGQENRLSTKELMPSNCGAGEDS